MLWIQTVYEFKKVRVRKKKMAVWRIRDVYPGSRILIFTHPGSRITDPKTAMKDRGEKKFVVIPFFWRHKFHKIELFYFWNVEEKNLGQFWKNYRTFYPQKMSLSSKTYGLGIRDPEKTYSGSRIQGSKRHRIPDPQHWKMAPKLMLGCTSWMIRKK